MEKVKDALVHVYPYVLPRQLLGLSTVLVFLWQVKLKQGLKIAMGISTEGNAYLQVILFFSFFHLPFYL